MFKKNISFALTLKQIQSSYCANNKTDWQHCTMLSYIIYTYFREFPVQMHSNSIMTSYVRFTLGHHRWHFAKLGLKYCYFPEVFPFKCLLLPGSWRKCVQVQRGYSPGRTSFVQFRLYYTICSGNIAFIDMEPHCTTL